jgi:hypothetical protein
MSGLVTLRHSSAIRSLSGRTDIGQGARNDAIDPSRHFATVKCCTAKGSFALMLGASRQLPSLVGQERGRTTFSICCLRSRKP